jgi:drug/metabolite transporter (DMT)-like permease
MRRYEPWTVLFYALFFAAAFWNIVVPPFESLRCSYSLFQWSLILYIVVLGTIVPYLLYSEGINLIRSTRASVTATLEPITAAFISYWFLGEILQPLQMIGGLLVITSVVFLQLRQEYDEGTSALIRARSQGEESSTRA